MPSNQKALHDQQYRQLVLEAIHAVKTGDRERARSLLEKATQLNAADALPWIWLSATTDDPAKQRTYLECAVAAEPGNAAARRGLLILSEKLDKSRLLRKGTGVEPGCPREPLGTPAEVYLCSKCGGHMVFNIKEATLSCAYCGCGLLLYWLLLHPQGMPF